MPLIIARYEAVKGDANMQPERLDRIAANPLTSEWMAAHTDEVGKDGWRSMASLESTADLFDADLSSRLARGTWLRQTKEAYAQLLEQRKAERNEEAEAAASRARAAAAMGLDTAAPLRRNYDPSEQERGPVLFAELQSLNQLVEQDDYCDEDGWDLAALESDIAVAKGGLRFPG